MESKVLINLARNQRKSKNPWEAKLWRHLRNRNFYGVKFKRQVRISSYIVDLCSNEKRLIIELDGGHHNNMNANVKDIEREKFLKSQKYIIIRFWNNEVENNVEGVLETIQRAIL